MIPPENRELPVEEAGELLRSVGLRRTILRLVLLQTLAGQEIPRTQAELVDELAPHGFDASSIFRGLTDLTECGLAIRIAIGDRLWRFEYRDRLPDGSRTVHHHSHIVCQKCGKITCLNTDAKIQLNNLVDGWLIEDLIMRGLCDQCRDS